MKNTCLLFLYSFYHFGVQLFYSLYHNNIIIVDLIFFLSILKFVLLSGFFTCFVSTNSLYLLQSKFDTNRCDKLIQYIRLDIRYNPAGNDLLRECVNIKLAER